jgi:hypothetical protein
MFRDQTVSPNRAVGIADDWYPVKSAPHAFDAEIRRFSGRSTDSVTDFPRM